MKKTRRAAVSLSWVDVCGNCGLEKWLTVASGMWYVLVMDYDNNVYCFPEKHGLELIADIDFAGDYEFDMVIVLRDKASGKLYAAADSGCSCPTPFENHVFPTDYIEVNKMSDITSLIHTDRDDSQNVVSKVFDFKNKVRPFTNIEKHTSAAPTQLEGGAFAEYKKVW